MNVSKTEKQRAKEEEIKLLQERDVSVILRNVIGAMGHFKNSKDQRASNYWKGAVEHWINSGAAVLATHKSADYLLVQEIEKAKDEFRERLEMLRKIEEDGIDLIIDDLATRFDTIVETTRVNDLSPVKARIIDRIREINTEILLLSETVAINNKRNILNELIELKNLIPS